MTRTKRFAATAAALVMAVSMVTAASTMTAFAADGDQTITVNAGTTATYNVYQLLVGTFDADGNIVNPTVGSSVASGKTVDEILNLVTDLDDTTGVRTAKTEAEAAAVDFTAVLGTKVTTLNSTTTSYTGPQGYYLLEETKTIDGTDQTAKILKVVKVNGDLSIKDKISEDSTFQKKLKDVDDSTANSLTDWQDGADWDIGDMVPFQLKATLPSNISTFKGYYLQFNDTMSDAFTFSDDTTVFDIKDVYIMNGTTKKSLTKGTDYAVEGSGHNFTVTFADIQYSGAQDSAEVYVEYEAKFGVASDEDSVKYGSQGNPNGAFIKFSKDNTVDLYGEGTPGTDNPRTPDESEKKTSQTDYVKVFTYKTVVNKFDNDDTALEGATFTLNKVLPDNSEQVVQQVTPAADAKTFEFYGLDDGKYILRETKAPKGFKAIEDYTFTISATHTGTATTDFAVNAIELTGLSAAGATTDAHVAVGTVDIAAGNIPVNVADDKISPLPETGGMGTKLFYAGGGALVLVSGVILVARKRAKSEQ